MSAEYSIEDIKKRLDGAHASLLNDFGGLRTGRASVSLLDPVQVDSYGSMVPLKSVGSISAPEARLLTVQLWDKGMVTTVCKAIINAGLGLNPQPDGLLIRLPIPELNEERRKEISKVAAKYAEAARVAVRNVRRDALDTLKRQQKASEISEDELRRETDNVQKEVDKMIAQIDTTLKDKEKDIMTV
ncbi:MAG: ribosome recycling factor [Pseudomonadota bacterium]